MQCSICEGRYMFREQMKSNWDRIKIIIDCAFSGNIMLWLTYISENCKSFLNTRGCKSLLISKEWNCLCINLFLFRANETEKGTAIKCRLSNRRVTTNFSINIMCVIKKHNLQLSYTYGTIQTCISSAIVGVDISIYRARTGSFAAKHKRKDTTEGWKVETDGWQT
jgi:hypothetical protein